MATINSLRDLLDQLSTEVDALATPDPAPYITSSGTFSHAIGDSGAELLGDADSVYIDVSIVKDGAVELDEDDIEELIEALQAALAYRRQQLA